MPDVKTRKIKELYFLWRSLPPFFVTGKAGNKQFNQEELENLLQIDDDELKELMAVKTQLAFADKYGVNKSTLTTWNNELKERDPLIDIRRWANKLTKNVISSLYRNANLTDPRANQDRKLFLQVIAEWNEKFEHQHKAEGLFDLIKELHDDTRKKGNS